MTGRLAAHWPHIAARLARAGRLAVLTDFDGTLAPIHRRKEAVELPASVRRTLERLRAAGHVVGIISGRALGDLRRRVGLPGLWYAGDHGFFLQSPGGAVRSLVRPPDRAEVLRAGRALKRRLVGVAGVSLEFKETSVAVHYRGARAASRRAARRAVGQVTRGRRRLRVLAGRKVLEILPRVPVDKAVAVRAILRAEKRRHPGPLPAVFIGDDVTDEPVFALRLSLTVAVGRRPKGAAYRLRSPRGVANLLNAILAIPRRST